MHLDKLKTTDSLDVRGKRVLVRADLNVPVRDGKVSDATRLARLVPGLQDLAKRAFYALGCDGMARVDFFLRPDGSALVNEINTIPGFTDISMFPKALAASGIAYPDLIDRVIRHGIARGA